MVDDLPIEQTRPEGDADLRRRDLDTRERRGACRVPRRLLHLAPDAGDDPRDGLPRVVDLELEVGLLRAPGQVAERAREEVPLAALGHRRLEQGVDVRAHVHESRLDGEAALAMCDLQRLVETMGHLLAYRSPRLGHRHPAHVNAGNADSLRDLVGTRGVVAVQRGGGGPGQHDNGQHRDDECFSHWDPHNLSEHYEICPLRSSFSRIF